MMSPEIITPVTMPTAAPKPENPIPIPSDVILKASIKEPAIVQTKERRLV